MPPCAKCGTILFEGTDKCPTCGHIVAAPSREGAAERPRSVAIARPEDRRALVALVLGVLGLFLCPIVLSVPAIFFGVRVLRRTARGGPGRGLAIGAVVTGIAGIVWGLLLGVFVAVPAYVGVRTRALDRQAQTSLSDSLATAKTLGGEGFEGVTTVGLRALDRKTKYLAADEPSSEPGSVSVLAGDGFVIAASFSRSGTCFFIGSRSGNTAFGKLKMRSQDCRADAFERLPIEEGW